MAKGPDALALLVGEPKMKGGAHDEPDDSDMGGSAEERAVREFFDKGTAGDFKGATAAFRRAYAACEMAEPDDGEMSGASDSGEDDTGA